MTIHNAEEALTMPAFWQQRGWHVALSPERLWLVMLTLDAFAVLVAFLETHRPRRFAHLLYLGFVVVLLLNVFWHIGVAVRYRAYAPGLISAVLVNLPITIYLLRAAWARPQDSTQIQRPEPSE